MICKLILATTVSTVILFANDVYIAQSSAGGNTGLDCSNAMVYSYFNISGNWTGGTPTGITIGPGTTVHICGTLTATGGASGYLSFQAGGSSGNPITLKFETGSVMTAPYWGSQGAISAASVSYLIIDGGTNGTIQATDNGTALTFQNDGVGIYLSSVSNSEVKNVTLSNLYIHTQDPSDENGQATYGVEWLFGSNVSIDNNVCHDVRTCYFYSFQPSGMSSGILMHDNVAYNMNWGLIIGDDGSGGTLNSPVAVYNNTVHDFSNWDDNANNNHHDAVYCFVNASVLNACTIYNNYIYGDRGTHMNADIFASQNTGGVTCGGVQIFNNLSVNLSTSHFAANGFVQDWCTNSLIMNNTWSGATNSASSFCYVLNAGTGATVQNNICSTVAEGIYTAAASVITSSDYNDIYNISSSNSMTYMGSVYGSVAAWTIGTGFDAHSITSDPSLTNRYKPSSSMPLGVGINLFSTCNGQPNPGLGALCSDAGGIARPSSGAWYIGAYQFVPDAGAVCSGPCNVFH